MSTNQPNDKSPNEFEQVAADAESTSLLGEFLEFLGENKKWWLLPIVVVLILIGFLVALSGTAVAPFIYPLF
jgi:hypothetical protein